MSKIAKNLAENLSRTRKDRGWSQEDLAKKMDVHRNTITRWESGDGGITLDAIAKLGKVLGIDEMNLVENSDWKFFRDAAMKVASLAMEQLPEKERQALIEKAGYRLEMIGKPIVKEKKKS